MAKNPARNYAIEYVGKGTDKATVSVLIADAISAAQEPIGDELGDVVDTPDVLPVNLGWFVVTDYGATGDASTDDTAAIQDTIDAAVAAGGGTVYFPAGHYIIGGALQDTGDMNGQILIGPVSTSDPQVTIVFRGPLPPPYTVAGPQPEPGGYAILESTITGGTGTAAVFSAGNGTWPDKNNVRVHVEDLICLNHVNPSLTFWNLSIAQSGGSHGVYITTPDWDLTPTTEPTHSNAYGIKLPQWGESNGGRWDFMVGGHYTGFLQGELADAFPIIGQCKVGVELPFSEHPSKIHGHVTAGGTIIKVTGENRATIWLDIEHYTDPPFSGAAAWLVTTNDLDDGSDELYGDITWFSLDGVTQLPDHIFTINGGANAQTREIGDPAASSSPTGAAGGDLSGTYPNPSVVDDSHNHTAATVSGLGVLIPVEPVNTVSVDTGTPPGVTVTTKWGIDGSAMPYYDTAGATAGEEAALFFDPSTDHYVLIAYDF